MNRTEALEIVKKQLTERRYIHTVGVMETAIKLAKRFKADEKKAEIEDIFNY
jgi:HD superfamily phosphohydrolase YqeK